MNCSRKKMYFATLASWVLVTCMVTGPVPAWPAQNPSATKPGSPQQQTLWIVPHTHWEGAVFKTREEYLEIGLPHILTALKLLRDHPEYRLSSTRWPMFGHSWNATRSRPRRSGNM